MVDRSGGYLPGRGHRVSGWRVVTILFVVSLVLGACGAEGNDDSVSSGGAQPAPTMSTASVSSTASGSPAGSTAPRDPVGTLRIASAFLPATTDPAQDGYSLVQFGMGETLTRITADSRVEPWLAESVEAVDETTWRVILRDEAFFWDGTPVTAAEVKASLERTWEAIPAAAQYLDPATELTVVDDQTLDLTLPSPIPFLPNNLATFQLLIGKPGPEHPILTGPYQIAEHVPDDGMMMTAFADHWNGPPPIAEIDVRLVRDANARVLALQSGDADLATEVPSELVGGLGDEIEMVSGPSLRMHHIVLNHERLPMNDPAVREAMSLAIDRELLNQLTLAGLGTVSTSIFPPGVGIDTPDELVTDREQAVELLEGAGWVEGDEGVREKDGTRLAFTLYTYARRPELVPIAVSIQDQLKDLGFAVEVQQVEDIVAQLETGDVDAAMFSVNMLPTGDPFYAFDVTLVKDARYNYLGYESDELEELVEGLRTEPDAEARADLALQAQEVLRQDTANIYLIAAPRIVAFRAGIVSGYVHHPNDLYMIDSALAVDAD